MSRKILSRHDFSSFRGDKGGKTAEYLTGNQTGVAPI
jgi:hypothetical protein